MKLIPFVIIVPLVLIAALVVAAYICDRFHIGTNPNRQQTAFIPTSQDWDLYKEYLGALIQCVGHNYSSCGLCRPGDLPQHMAPYNQGIIYKDGVVQFVYIFDRKYCIDGGLGKYSYDTTLSQQIAQKLNATICNYCIAAGLVPAKIVDARDIGNGRIEFRLGAI